MLRVAAKMRWGKVGTEMDSEAPDGEGKRDKNVETPARNEWNSQGLRPRKTSRLLPHLVDHACHVLRSPHSICRLRSN